MPRRRIRRGPIPSRFAVVCALFLAAGGSAACAQAQHPSPRSDSPLRAAAATDDRATRAAPARTRVGPARGALVVAGGGRLTADIWSRFVALAGGPDARIVVIPGAGEDDDYPSDWGGLEPLRRSGALHLTVLHTRSRDSANDERFVAPLRNATGVWIPGGRQWRLTDAYLGTRVLGELNALLARGGVIGGTSAGASVQASYMVRGAPEGNHIMMAPGHEEGFGFLRGVAIDQHLLARARERDLLDVLAVHSDLLGIGLDEGTAIIVHGDTAEIVGRSKVAIYDAYDPDQRDFYFLTAGDRFDLAQRIVLPRR